MRIIDPYCFNALYVDYACLRQVYIFVIIPCIMRGFLLKFLLCMYIALVVSRCLDRGGRTEAGVKNHGH